MVPSFPNSKYHHQTFTYGSYTADELNLSFYSPDGTTMNPFITGNFAPIQRTLNNFKIINIKSD